MGHALEASCFCVVVGCFVCGCGALLLFLLTAASLLECGSEVVLTRHSLEQLSMVYLPWTCTRCAFPACSSEPARQWLILPPISSAAIKHRTFASLPLLLLSLHPSFSFLLFLCLRIAPYFYHWDKERSSHPFPTFFLSLFVRFFIHQCISVQSSSTLP